MSSQGVEWWRHSETEQYTHTSENQNQQLYEQKRRPVDDLVFTSFSLCLSLSFPNLQLFIASFPLTYCREDFCYVTGHVLCCPTFFKAVVTSARCSSLVSAQTSWCLCSFDSLKPRQGFGLILLLQGFYITRMKSFLGYYFRMIRMTSLLRTNSSSIWKRDIITSCLTWKLLPLCDAFCWTDSITSSSLLTWSLFFPSVLTVSARRFLIFSPPFLSFVGEYYLLVEIVH